MSTLGRLRSLPAVVLAGWWLATVGSAGVLASPTSVEVTSDTTSLEMTENEFFLAPPGNQPLHLAHGFVVPGSTKVWVEGRRWQAGVDYRVRARTGLVVPQREWRAAATDSTADAKRALVVVEYRFVPVPLRPRLDLRPVTPPPPPAHRVGRETAAADAREDAAWRAAQLQVSGSKTVQVSSGSRREMTVDQNLRLSILGNLTDDIAVKAFLSDDNLPVVPEGNTEELRDIDKVLVQLQAPAWEATLGDFVAQRRGTVFGAYRRKLQGVSLQAHPGRGTVEALAGSPRGIYRTVQLQGQEANQGPYHLGAGGAAANLFIVAGSERVTLDGGQLTRGADRDYVIDYVAGTVTFTYRQLITAESLITVEFEEGEGSYGRTVLGGGAGHRFTLPYAEWGGHLLARIIREKDDPGRLRTGELAATDAEVLAAAGDDPALAVAGGITVATPGEGQYDEGLAATKTIYIFNPDGGAFDVDFFYVGVERGDYKLERLTATGKRVYAHVGDGLGSYRIGRPLPLPEAHSVATLSAGLGDTTGSHVVGEWNAAELDHNQLSSRDDDDNQGWAGRVAAKLSGRPLQVGGRGLGSLGLSGFWEKRRAEFRPFQVHKTQHDYEAWGLGDRARRSGFLDEAERESGARASWRAAGEAASLDLSGSLGSLRHGPQLTADKTVMTGAWRLRGGSGNHRWQRSTAVDTDDPLSIRRDQRIHRLNWRLGPVVPSGRYEFRRWRDDAAPTTRAGGFRLTETAAGLQAAPGAPLAWRLEFQRGLADSLRDDRWQLQRDSRTVRAGATTGSFAGMRLVGDATWRRVLQPDGPEQTTRLARLDLSGRWDRSASDWSLGYRVDNSRTEVLDRQIVFVGESQGDFNEDGSFVGEDQGDYDLVLAGTDSLVATTTVRADLTWRQGFRFLGTGRWYGAWSALTLVSIEGRSTTDEVGRLLALDPAVIFARDAAVLGDFKFTEELSLLQHLRQVDLRLRFDLRQTRDRQFATHPEDRSDRGWQTTGIVNVTRRTSLKLRWARQDERRYSAESALSARRSQAVSAQRYEVGWNYHPYPNLRLGLQGEHLARADGISLVEQNETGLHPTLRARLRRQWILQADVRWSQVTSDEPFGSVRPAFFPYPGANVESSLRLSWEPSDNLTVAANWFGRRRGERGWQHDLRLETTARF